MGIARSPVDFSIAEKLEVEVEALKPDMLERYHLERLRKVVKYLKEHSWYYKEKLAHIIPEEIITIEDFKRLPTTTENDLAGNEWAFLCVNPDDVKRIVTVDTTGSSGKKKKVFFSERDLALAKRFVNTGFRTMSVSGDRFLIFMSSNTEGGIGDVVRKAEALDGIITEVYGPIDDLEKAFQAMLAFRPTVLVGYPSQLAALARFSTLHGKMEIKSVLLSGEDVPQAICERMRRVWNADSFCHFGMTELCVAGAVECGAHQGYHLRNEDVYFEVLNPDEKGFGQLAVTTFSHQAMPLLRYQTGDIVRMTDEPCGCGSPLPRIAQIKGRRSNNFCIGGNPYYLSELEEIFYMDPSVVDFECEVAGDRLSANLKSLKGEQPSVSEIRQALERKIPSSNIKIICSEFLGFEKGHHIKKRVLLK